MTSDNSPNIQQQRRDIEVTRDDMGRTMAEIEDRVSPSRMKQRQTERMRSKWNRARESIMGSSDGSSARGRASDAAHGAQDAVQQAPQRVESMARGNPMAAGLIALGVGALAGTLFPASRPERQMASELRGEFEGPVRDELQRSGHEMQSQLKEDAQQAMDETKQTAQQAMHRTQEQASGSAQQMGSSAKDAGQAVRQES